MLGAIVAAVPAQASYWTGSDDGYWESAANWVSVHNGYFFLSDSYTTKTVKFRQQSVLDNKTVSVQTAVGTAADSPIVFLADSDEYGFSGCDRLDAGEYKNGHLAIERGTFSCKYTQVGFATSTAEPLMRIGGGGHSATVNASGDDSKVFTGKMLVADGGTLNVGNMLIVGAADGKSGTLEIDGGDVKTVSGNGYFTIGDVANSSGTVVIRNGGRYSHLSTGWSNLGLVVGMRAAASLQVDGGEIDLRGNDLLFCYYGGSSAALEITGGGLLIANKIYNRGRGTANVTIDGGTVKASAGNASFIPADSNLHVYLGDGGATFDCVGFAVTIAEDLDDKSGETGTATFTSTGGTITLSGAVNYSGRTYLGDGTHLVLKDAAMKTKILSQGLAVIKPADASPKGIYTLLTCADGTAFTDADKQYINTDELPGATLFVEDGAMKIEVTKETQTWAGAAGTSLAWGGANWNGGVTWDDGNDAVFATDGAIASVDAAASATSVTFGENATVAGFATLAPGVVSVAASKEVMISAPTTGPLEKTGAGTLTLGASRPDATTLSDGTLVMDGSGTTLDWSKFSFGTDPNKPLALKFTGGAEASVSGHFNFGEEGCEITIDKDGGNLTIPNGFWMGAGNGGRNTFRNSGGMIDVSSTGDNFFVLGRGQSSDSTGQNSTNEFYMMGGTLTTHSWFLIGGNASTTEGRNYFEISNATVSQTQRNGVFLGYKSGGHNELCVKAGGVFNARDYITVGQDNSGSGILTVDGGEVNVPGNVTIANTSAASSVALKGGTLTAAQVKSAGRGDASLAFNGGTLRANATGTLIAENAKLAVTVGANGGTIDANGKSVTIAAPLLEDAQSTGGGMMFKGGGYIAVADGNTYTGVTTVEVGTALSVAAPIAGDKLAFTIPAGLADGVYAVVSVTGETPFAADVLDGAAKPAGAEFTLSSDKKTIYCIYGNVENSWMGGTAGVLTDPDSWVLRRVPGSGETAVISSAAAATLTIPEGSTFAPSVIVFPAGSAAVTIAGGGTIGGVAAVTNLSSNIQTIACPLTFADAWRVHCASAAVNFSGGAAATSPAADNTDNVASRALMGDITFTQNWTATGSMTSCYTVPNGSRLYGKAITGELTDTTILRVEAGGYAQFDSVLTGNENGRVSVRGEMVVKGVWVIAGSVHDFVGAEGDQNYRGVLRAGGIWKGDDTHGMSKVIFVKVPNIYVGSEGFGAKTRDYYFQFEGDSTIYAADDFEMFGLKRSGYEWDWGFNRYGNGNTTIDTQGHTVMWTAGAMGGGGIVKDGEGTLVMNPYGSSMTGAFTVNAGMLQLAKSGATGTGGVTVKNGAALGVSGTEAIGLGGDLTLEDGAVLAFELTQRSAVPQLAIAEGKSVTANGTVKVKVSATCPWPTGGEKQLTTGGDFTGVSVSLAEGAPKWAKGVYVNDDGNIVLDVKPMGTKVIVR